MWTTEYAASTSAAPAAVWAALTALHSGTPLGPNSDSFELLEAAEGRPAEGPAR